MSIPHDMLRELIYFQDRINNLFEERLKNVYSSEADRPAEWIPSVDVYETPDTIYLTAEIPGVDLDDVRIEADERDLLLTGCRPFPKEGLKKEDYYRLEGSYGAFGRRFTLPAPVDQNRIKATLKDGVLRVILPKMSSHQITKIAIESE